MKGDEMKRSVTALLATALVVALAIIVITSNHGVRAVYAHSGCSIATLSGSYGLSFTGFSGRSERGPVNVPHAGNGLATFDGAGNFAANYTDSFNNEVNQGVVYTATYTVSPDCTGTFTGTGGGDNFVFTVVHDGAEVLALDTFSRNMLSVDLKKQRDGY
jgi:hypothetical protein